MNPFRPGRASAWVLTLAIALTPAPLTAASRDADPVELEPVVVVATKSPRPLSDVAGQVTVIDARHISTWLLEEPDDLFRYQPGIDARSQGTRFGVNDFVIRGIGGNRVAIEIDGVPVRDGFRVGSYSSASRALFDTERIKRVEILHGPASTLYGSDALGGVLAITTWDPADLMAGADGKNRHYGLRAGASGVDSSHVLSARAAWANGRQGLMVSARRREGHESDSNAVGDDRLDPRNWERTNYSGRWTWDSPNGDRLRLSVDRLEDSAETEVRSLLGYGRFRTTSALSGDDEEDRLQAALDWTYSRNWVDEGLLRAFLVRTDTRQATDEERALAAVPVRIWRYFEYSSDLAGLEATLFRNFTLGGGSHRLGAGIEYLHSDYSEFRDGLEHDLLTGSVSSTILGETFPVRDFPESSTSETGLFVQGEIQLADGRWQLIPALRFEHFNLDPRPDAVYREDNPDTDVVSVDESRLNPRLGVVRKLGEAWSAYGQYVEGFRAPPFEDVNIGLDIPLFNIRAIPNPDLESETSRGMEFGVRFVTGETSFSAALFDTRFDDFIESRVLVGVDPATGVLLFQSRNVESARIYGADVRFRQSLERWAHGMNGWSLNLAVWWARGENRVDGQPLNSVSPPQAVVGLSWISANGRWDAALNATWTARQDEIDHTGGARFSAPASTVLDLVAGWRLNRHLSLRATLRNATDETWWRWADIADLPATDPMIPLLAQPGRNLSVSARLDF